MGRAIPRTAVREDVQPPNDVVATLYSTRTNAQPTGVNVYDPGTGTVSFYRLAVQQLPRRSIPRTRALMARFHRRRVRGPGDPGHRERSMFGAPLSRSLQLADLSNVGAGLIFGAPTVVTPNPQPFTGAVADGGRRFQRRWNDPRLRWSPVLRLQCSVQIFAVDPKTLAVAMVPSIPCRGSRRARPLGGGRFGRHGPLTSLVVSYQPASATRSWPRSISMHRCNRASRRSSQDISGSAGFFRQGGSPGLVLTLR